MWLAAIWRWGRRAVLGCWNGITGLGIVEKVIGLPGDWEDLATWLSWIDRMIDVPYIVLGVFATVGVGMTVLEFVPAVRRRLYVPTNRKREYTRLTAAEILAKFDGRTDAEARRMLRPHFDLWLRRIDGDVVDVVETPDTATVVIRLESGHHYGNLEFSKGDKEGSEAATLPPGERITATGRIEGIDRLRVWLTECELTDV